MWEHKRPSHLLWTFSGTFPAAPSRLKLFSDLNSNWVWSFSRVCPSETLSQQKENVLKLHRQRVDVLMRFLTRDRRETGGIQISQDEEEEEELYTEKTKMLPMTNTNSVFFTSELSFTIYFFTLTNRATWKSRFCFLCWGHSGLSGTFLQTWHQSFFTAWSFGESQQRGEECSLCPETLPETRMTAELSSLRPNAPRCTRLWHHRDRLLHPATPRVLSSCCWQTAWQTTGDDSMRHTSVTCNLYLTYMRLHVKTVFKCIFSLWLDTLSHLYPAAADEVH